MLYRLIYLTGPRTGQRVTVETEPMTMGRSPECAVVLEDPEAAAQHAEIVHRGDAVFVRDLGSMHRILVNQREVNEARLKHGDQLEVARTRFLVQCCVQAEVSRAGPPRRRLHRIVRVALPLLLATTGLAFWRSRSGQTAPSALPPQPAEGAASVPPPAADPLAAPAPAPVPGPADAGAVSPVDEAAAREISAMRQQLDDLNNTVRKMTLVPPAPSREAKPLNSFHPHDALKERTEKMLALAKADAEAGRWADADRQLANIQIIDADFLEAYVQRAALLEKRGMIQKAIEQWTEVVARSVGTPLYERAVAERLRLGARSREVPADGPLLRVSRAEVQRFPENESVQELRLLTVQVAPLTADPLDPEAVRVESTFFVRPAGGEEPVAVTSQVTRVTGEWKPGAERTFTASYVVPRGAAPPGEFHGFVVGVYYRDRLQATEARPRSLLVAGAAGRPGVL